MQLANLVYSIKGFIRSLDEKLQIDENYYMTSRCVSYADRKGGSEALAVAERFFDLGFEVAVLVDNDRPEDEKKKMSLSSKGITIFSWEAGKCIETALLPLLSKKILAELLLWDSEKKDATWNELIRQGFAIKRYSFIEDLNKTDLLKVAEICSNKEFFKRVSGGEALGKRYHGNTYKYSHSTYWKRSRVGENRIQNNLGSGSLTEDHYCICK